jgi:hypothetical protein
VVLLVLFGLLKIASAEPLMPVPEELQYLEESNRGEWQMPERVIDALRLQKSDVVADVGPPLSARLSEEDFLQEGLELDRKLTFLPDQYLLIFTK